MFGAQIAMPVDQVRSTRAHQHPALLQEDQLHFQDF
jgi:hypothetical protein